MHHWSFYARSGYGIARARVGIIGGNFWVPTFSEIKVLSRSFQFMATFVLQMLGAHLIFIAKYIQLHKMHIKSTIKNWYITLSESIHFFGLLSGLSYKVMILFFSETLRVLALPMKLYMVKNLSHFKVLVLDCSMVFTCIHSLLKDKNAMSSAKTGHHA